MSLFYTRLLHVVPYAVSPTTPMMDRKCCKLLVAHPYYMSSAPNSSSGHTSSHKGVTFPSSNMRGMQSLNCKTPSRPGVHVQVNFPGFPSTFVWDKLLKDGADGDLHPSRGREQRHLPEVEIGERHWCWGWHWGESGVLKDSPYNLTQRRIAMYYSIPISLHILPLFRTFGSNHIVIDNLNNSLFELHACLHLPLLFPRSQPEPILYIRPKFCQPSQSGISPVSTSRSLQTVGLIYILYI